MKLFASRNESSHMNIRLNLSGDDGRLLHHATSKPPEYLGYCFFGGLFICFFVSVYIYILLQTPRFIREGLRVVSLLLRLQSAACSLDHCQEEMTED